MITHRGIIKDSIYITPPHDLKLTDVLCMPLVSDKRHWLCLNRNVVK